MNDDPGSGTRVTLGSAQVVEGDSARRTVRLAVALSSATQEAVTAEFHCVDGTATGGVDFVTRSGTVRIPAGGTSTTIDMKVEGDRTVEGAEQFSCVLDSAVNASIGRRTGFVTILDDDPI